MNESERVGSLKLVDPERVAASFWTLMELANPNCPESLSVLESILDRRALKHGEKALALIHKECLSQLKEENLKLKETLLQILDGSTDMKARELALATLKGCN